MTIEDAQRGSAEAKFSSLANLEGYRDRQRAHQMLDVLDIPRGMTLEQRVDLLECRYPEAKGK